MKRRVHAALLPWLITIVMGGCYTTSTSVRRSNKPLPVGITAWPVAPPRLGAKLERFYPDEARARSLTGSASLRIRVLEDGSINVLEIVRATESMFGDACGKMLLTTRWTPALDNAGKPTRLEVAYVCDFTPTKTCSFCATHEDLDEGL